METQPLGLKGYEQILNNYFSSNEEKKSIVLDFIKNFPKLPSEPDAAFEAIRSNLVRNGFEYDGQVFVLEEVIDQKRGNCLGLSLLFGAILEEQGFDISYEVAVNPKDAHYRNDIKQFDRAIHGDIFPYDELPDLPNQKVETPQGWFTPLEHPVLIVGGKRYETTSLIDETNTDNAHNYESESQRPITYENLIGSSFVAKAKSALQENQHLNIEEIMATTKKGLDLWPTDRQGWLFLRDLALHNFDDNLAALAEEKFRTIGGDDSLFYFSLYEITGEETLLEKALSKYPAFISAFLRKSIRLPLQTEDQKREARFNFTVASVCVANSSEIDLTAFYVSNINTIAEAFGIDYATDLLYDLEVDNRHPIDYCLTMYQLKKDVGYLVEAFEKGVIENSTPLDCLNFCEMIIKNAGDIDQEIVLRCKNKIEEIEETFGKSDLFKKALERQGVV